MPEWSFPFGLASIVLVLLVGILSVGLLSLLAAVKRSQKPSCSVLSDSCPFRGPFEASFCGLALLDDHFCIILGNPALADFLEIEPSALSGQKITEFLRDDDTELIQGLNPGQGQGQRIAEAMNREMITAYGEPRRAKARLDSLETNEAGGSYLLHVLDTTESSRTRDHLWEAYSIINSSPSVAFIWRNEADWPVSFVSNNVATLCGYSAYEFLNGHVRYAQIIHPEDLPRVAEEVGCHAIDAGTSHFTHEPYRIITKEGSVKWVKDSTSIIRDEQDTVRYFQGIVEDISSEIESKLEQSRLEEQLRHSQKMEAIGTLAGGIAHEFNNLLQGIRGNLECLEESPEPSGQALRRMDAIVARGSEMVEELLTFSRKRDPGYESVHVGRIISNGLQILRRTLPRQIELESHIEPDMPSIQANPIQLEQVLINLCNNACEAIDLNQGGKISLTARAVEVRPGETGRERPVQPGLYVLLEVSDTGCGMDEQTRKQIFDPFFTTKDIGKGTGLGLSTVFGIVRGHSGAIFCQSEPGLGTSFSLYFPCQHSSKEPSPGSSGQEAIDENLRGNETILIVEDEPIVLDPLREMLSLYGYTVLEASDGAQAMELFSRQKVHIDLVVLDLSIPARSGEQVLQEMLAEAPAMKVLICSGYSEHRLARDPQSHGAVGFLSKPFQYRDLLSMIRGLLDKAVKPS